MKTILGAILIDDQSAPSLTAAILNHFKSVQIKKKKDEAAEGEEEQVARPSTAMRGGSARPKTGRYCGTL